MSPKTSLEMHNFSLEKNIVFYSILDINNKILHLPLNYKIVKNYMTMKFKTLSESYTTFLRIKYLLYDVLNQQKGV